MTVVQVVERIAVLVCPPELSELGLSGALLREVGLQLAALPPSARRALGLAMWYLDQAARLRPSSRGKRFTRLDDVRADAYLRTVLYGRWGPVAGLVRLVKSVVVMCYYDLPEVRAALGYDPDRYVAEVAARRIALYGKEIS
jgi:hypothetical protein